MGPTSTRSGNVSSSMSVNHCNILPNLDILLERFWKTEELPEITHFTKDEEECETIFVSTHSRAKNGQYIVRLPFKSRPPDIGDSFSKASILYKKQEARLVSKPSTRVGYHEFLNEYAQLNHMSLVQSDDVPHGKPIYLPHHPVVKEDSSTTRIRVVFNASSKTSNGTSLNDHLLVGPKLQNDLPSIMMRWRRYKFVYTADIAKMFRQILIDPIDTDFQRILWRPEPENSILSYRLLTVTYGTACAPYLALRVLKQLAQDEGSRFPLATPILENDIFVDDALFGADDLNSARLMRQQLCDLLASGGFHLRKFSSNNNELLKDIPSGDHELAFDKPHTEGDFLKVLGIIWYPASDSFKFKINLEEDLRPTKRMILSTIARLFDPLGWSTPVIIKAKIIMQDLWREKLDWDSPIPPEFLNHWLQFHQDLPSLEQLTIVRWTRQSDSVQSIELHGFADASSKAFAAAVFLRVVDSFNNAHITLICAKSKVAPLKTLSIPRLELNAALLLAKTVKYVQEAMQLFSIPVHCWTDSIIVLAWLSQHPSRWKTFVANRVADIQITVPQVKWRHIPSDENPADCASRGLLASELISHPLWWEGPEWLKSDSTSWPVQQLCLNFPDDSESRNVSSHVTSEKPVEWQFVHKFSSWPRLLRVTLYCLRFIRFKILKNRSTHSPKNMAEEIVLARQAWIKYVQYQLFAENIIRIQKNLKLSRSSKLRKLDPFLDSDGMLRVGGRLRNSLLPHNEKFPIILGNHRISELIIAQVHQQTLHGGPQLTLRTLRQDYWILNARNLVRSHINKCVSCVRERASKPTQIMGDLPEARVRIPEHFGAFAHTGVDYAGPIPVLPVTGRGQHSRKSYVAIFVCLASKAVHLELVLAYTTPAFLAAFQRFCSRRCIPSDLYWDPKHCDTPSVISMWPKSILVSNGVDFLSDILILCKKVISS